MTTLIIKNCYGSVTIEVDKDDMDVEGMLEDLFKPAMLGLTYHPFNIESIIYKRD